VHLSTTPEKAWQVATFRTGNPRVIQAKADACQEAGVKMMTVNKDIVISEMIPSRFLSIIPAKDILNKKERFGSNEALLGQI
jgi:putative RNA 2'-phosphotransferase